MVIYLIGHRGSGKSEFLKRLKPLNKYHIINKFDLDNYIEKKYNKTIDEIFKNEGEEAFRQLEKLSHLEILKMSEKMKSETFIIALGAGFSAWEDLKGRVVHIARDTDSKARVFLDRPRLIPDSNPWQEYDLKFKQRNNVYVKYRDQVLLLEEGFSDGHAYEQKLFWDEIGMDDAEITLLDSDFLMIKLNYYLKLGFRRIELRTDLLTKQTIRNILNQKSNEANRFLVSFRNNTDTDFYNELLGKQIEFDWALEIGNPPKGFQGIVSCHSWWGKQGWIEKQQKPDVKETVNKLNELASIFYHIKWAPLVDDFNTIYEGYNWCLSYNKNKSFLPRSLSGRWSWFRALMAKQKHNQLNFVREAEGSSKDQPTLLEWLRVRTLESEYFAAVLGSPISHSQTPAEHYSYFKKKKVAIFRIDVKKHEDSALVILKKLGLRWAAVTSPLKQSLLIKVNSPSAQTQKYQSLNTLYINNNTVYSENTDAKGFQQACNDLDLLSQKKVVLWGGGGVRSIVKECFPVSIEYSASKGFPRNTKTTMESPELLIWASGDDNSVLKNLPQSWKVKIVLDLNYTYTSPARAYAKDSGAKYLSGDLFFKKQANLQREFWDGINGE